MLADRAQISPAAAPQPQPAEGGPTPAEEAQHAAELAAEAAGAPRAVEALDSDDDSEGSGREGGVGGGSAVRASRQGLGKLARLVLSHFLGDVAQIKVLTCRIVISCSEKLPESENGL